MRKGQLAIGIALALALALATSALALVYYNMQINMTWKVELNYGLELWNEDKTQKISSIDFGTIPKGGLATGNFYVKNTGNIAAKVHLNMDGNYEGSWTVTTDFVQDQTILKDGFSTAFNIAVQDISADSSVLYNGVLTFIAFP